MVGEFVRGDRDAWVIATKFTDAPPGTDANRVGNGRKSLVRSVERSLARLGTDYIDVLWVHAWDFTTPEEEVMRSLDDLIRAGKALYIGLPYDVRPIAGAVPTGARGTRTPTTT